MSFSIQVPNSEEGCAFCDYLSGNRPYSFVERGGLTATLVTREQRGINHLLVIPVRHVETILDLTETEGAALIKQVIRVATAIDISAGRPGISVWQNNGVPASQSIPHVHFHVAGTLPGGGTDWGEVRELEISETDEIARIVRRHLPA